MKNLPLICLLFPLLICSCEESKPSNEFKVIPISDKQEELKASEFIADIQYIPLETDSVFLSDIKIMCPTRDDFFIFDGEQIARFNKAGRFLNIVGKKGKGPQEFSYVKSFTVSEPTKTVWVAKPEGIVIYKYDGSFHQNIILPAKKQVSSLQAYGDKMLCLQSNASGQSPVSWYCLDKDGNEVGSRPNHFRFNTVKWNWAFFKEHFFYTTGNNLYCKEMNSDTIFRVGGRNEPVFVLDQQDRGFDIATRTRDYGHYWMKNSGKHYVFKGILGTDKYLFLNFYYQGKYTTNVYRY
ncbi:hypothetical protein FUAX_47900 (plasmid) [Fulvitalea axinellae]|uniref:6-bladed beta-propeller n=1 Tax=Fulvitalea axinellae TaxID=1182444 RepID=A0AAU9CQ57_9BACT|nr:hypothetical protein FUAX_47900 [Fulvitalea axinellae]